MKKLSILFFVMVFLLVLGFGTSALAYLTYTDTQSGATIEYDLNFLTSNTAQFTVNVLTAGSSDWYIGAWNLKLFQSGTPATIGTYTVPTDWLPTDGTQNTDIAIWGWSRSDGQSGFFDSNFEGISAGSTPTNFPDNGISLGSTGTTTFTFDFSGSGSQTLFTSGMPFQVAYFGDGTAGGGGNQFNQLSKELNVPEPQSMLLLGVALIGLVGIGRRKIFKK